MRYPALIAGAATLLVLPAGSAAAQREQTADQQVVHVLNRLAFGPRPGDVEAVRKIGVDAWIDRQLHPERIADPTIDQLLARYPMLKQDQNALAREYSEFVRARALRRQAKRDTTGIDATNTTSAASGEDAAEFREVTRLRTQLVAQLESSRAARAVASERQLLEVMTDFWENHFNVYVRKGAPEPYYLVEYDRAIRAHALGSFRELLGVVAHSPAMLFYLDNARSRANPGAPTLAPDRTRSRNLDRLARNPRLDSARQVRLQQAATAAKQAGLNENYGRELLELHTLGVDGGYTQHDVIDVARALTGWTIRPPAQGGGFVFRPAWHDAGTKTILGVRFPAGGGEDEGERVLDLVARHPATARFIARKLTQRFVRDTPPPALVARAAQTFLRTGGDIREVVRTIVTSPEFFAAESYHAKVKSPFEVVVSAARALGARPDTTPASALAVAYLGQPLFGHQAPNGWPETGEAWMNTGAILNRINFGMAVGADRLPGAPVLGFPGADTLRAAPRTVQVDAVVRAILHGAVSPDTRKILSSGENPLAAAAAARPVDSLGVTSAPEADDMPSGVIAPRARPRRNAFGRTGLGPPPKLDGLAEVIGLALGSPEFQRR